MTLPARIRTAGFSTAARNSAFQRKFKPSLQAAGTRNPGHGAGRSGEGRRHGAGEVVRQSGIYEVVHDREHREVHEVVMISGERFPDCETCKAKVQFRLVRTAPYIFQDEDFEEET